MKLSSFQRRRRLGDSVTAAMPGPILGATAAAPQRFRMGHPRCPVEPELDVAATMEIVKKGHTRVKVCERISQHPSEEIGYRIHQFRSVCPELDVEISVTLDSQAQAWYLR